jgi:hypothetical protein
LKSAELPRLPDRHQREAQVLPFPAARAGWFRRFIGRPLLRSNYRVFHAVFVMAWLLFLGSISFLAVVVR